LIDESVVERIRNIYATCSYDEQMILRQILQEIVDTGDSETYEHVWLADFKEVPVSIDQFISDPYYLGETTKNGEMVYPFWRQTLTDIFNHGNQYNEIILSGATRIGKTATSVKIMAYMLYRLMLYRDPQGYFGLQPHSKLTLAFANLTKDLAAGVAFSEFNQTLKHSKWFMEHGTMNRGTVNQIYVPNGDIEIIAGSSASNFLGMQIWCLIGDTEILTIDGIKTLEECAGTMQTVFQDIDGELVPTTANIELTKYVTETIRIELEDGTVVEGTPDHKVLLSDGTYKALGELSSSDDLLTFNICEEVDEMNLKSYSELFKVYVHTSPSGKKYVGITSKPAEVRWGLDGSRYKSNTHFWDAIKKYGWSNFKHEIVAEGLSLHDACSMEHDLINLYNSMDPNFGYNHTTGGNWSTPDEFTRKKISDGIRRSLLDPEVRKRRSDCQIGHVVTSETRKKISDANTGRKRSKSFCEKQRNRVCSDETREKLRNHSSWNHGLTKYTDQRLMRVSEMFTGREVSDETRKRLSASRKAQYENGYDPVWITNGEVETSIQRGMDLPHGFTYGRLNNLDTYVHKDGVSKKICHIDLESYISDGWTLGRPKSVGQSIKRANQKMHWEYNGMRFDTAQELATYLNSNGYPNIVDSTITSLSNKGFDKSPKYRELHGKVVKVLHENKINTEN